MLLRDKMFKSSKWMSYLSDKEIVIAAVETRANTLVYATDTLQTDPDVLIATIRYDNDSFNINSPLLHYCPEHLKNDGKFLARVSTINPRYRDKLERKKSEWFGVMGYYGRIAAGVVLWGVVLGLLQI